MFMVGSTLGESIVPILTGWAMVFLGPWVMPWTIFFCALILLGLYLVIYYRGPIEAEALTRDDKKSERDNWGNRSQHSFLHNPLHKMEYTKETEENDVEMVSINFVESNQHQTD
jgi:hypothetical protein